MNNKRNKIIYLVSTVLLTLLMGVSVGNYIFNHEMVSERITDLGFPTYLIYLMAIAKTLGLIAIWTKKNQTLKEWAYAGFFFNLVLAIIAHLGVGDGEFAPPLVGLVLLLASYFSEKKIAQNIA